MQSIRISASATRKTGNLSVQRDLPGSLQLTATYLGIKGTRGVQEFLPNTYPIGAAESLPRLPRRISLTSPRMAIQPARRADSVAPKVAQRPYRTALYTFSKSIDDDSALEAGSCATLKHPSSSFSGGRRRSSSARPDRAELARLSAERGLSTFDQRHFSMCNCSTPRAWDSAGNADERLEGNALQRVDRLYRRSRRQRPAGDAHLSRTQCRARE